MEIPVEKLASMPGGRLIIFAITIWQLIKYPRREVWCRRCREWHPVSYGIDKNGYLTDLLMGSRCGKQSYLVGVAGKAIDGQIIRRR